MATVQQYVAVDLGAESGRIILGNLSQGRLELSEVHRFRNGPVSVPAVRPLADPVARRLSAHLYWDALGLWSEVKEGIKSALRKYEGHVVGIGVDAWGVDYALLDQFGAMLSCPYHYRDSRTEGMLSEAFRRMPRAQIFELTGIQFMPINTLYQLLSLVVGRSGLLDSAETLLTIPDLFNYWLTGEAVAEFTNATTTQCYDPRQGSWSDALLAAMGIPRRIFPSVVAPGTKLGLLSRVVADEIGVSPVPVIAPACHDTGSAVAAIPAVSPRFAWISSGTWSILGTETSTPLISTASLERNLTNEGGVGGTFRLSKNILGLWLLQECRRTWANAGQEFSYAELAHIAGQSPSLVSLVDPDCAEFLQPGDMPVRLIAFCQRTAQAVPTGHGPLVRCILESIALKYRHVLVQLEETVGHRLEPIHIVGGGSQNRLLNQFTANATGRRVLAGPSEATAMGNILVQAMALGHVASVTAARAIVRDSAPPEAFEPTDQAVWDEAYGRFLGLMDQV